MNDTNFITQRETEEKNQQEEKQKQAPEPDSKTEGIANDISNTFEPLLRAGEKMFGLDRSAVGTWLIKGAIKGQLGGVDGLFGAQKKKTRIEKFKEVAEISVWIGLLLMLFFWINYGMARWLGVIK